MTPITIQDPDVLEFLEAFKAVNPHHPGGRYAFLMEALWDAMQHYEEEVRVEVLQRLRPDHPVVRQYLEDCQAEIDLHQNCAARAKIRKASVLVGSS